MDRKVEERSMLQVACAILAYWPLRFIPQMGVKIAGLTAPPLFWLHLPVIVGNRFAPRTIL